MADLYVRSYNPIWDFRSLTGLPLDDTSWAYFLENDLPYLPQTVYQTPNGVPWNSPVQLSAAGTLQNIFFDPSKVYRIEIRTNVGNLTPPSQQDALVWLIEDYVPNGGGNPPITTATLASTNQITNPQYSLISFFSPLSLNGQTDQTVTIAPGWDLVLTGGGDYEITQIPLNASSECPTNSPYALSISLTGWTGAYLRQRFNQSGTLWTSDSITNPKYIAASITARIEGAPQVITTTLVDSENNLLATPINTTVTANYEEFIGTVLMPISSNDDVPPNAYVEYRINLPGNSNISLTSVQLISTSSAVPLRYEQQTIERQVDQTFHYYRDSILFQPKDNLLTGWDFLLNPWQFSSKTLTNLTGNGSYTADQTIVISEEADSLQVGQSIAPLGYFEVASRTAVTQGRFAVIQYIEPASIASVWSTLNSIQTKLSAMAQMQLFTEESTVINVKMRLIYSTTLPTTVDPISSWNADGPLFTGQWTEISPINDPAYTITDQTQNFSYNGFDMPDYSTATQTLGIVLYTISPMSSVSSDALLIKSVSLVQNDFAILINPLSYDETLRRCQYYYEKSYDKDVVPPEITEVGKKTFSNQTIYGGGVTNHIARTFTVDFSTVKRTSAPDITLYSPASVTPAQILLNAYLNGASSATVEMPIATYFEQNAISSERVTYTSKISTSAFEGGNENYDAFQELQYICDARLGLVP